MIAVCSFVTPNDITPRSSFALIYQIGIPAGPILSGDPQGYQGAAKGASDKTADESANVVCIGWEHLAVLAKSERRPCNNVSFLERGCQDNSGNLYCVCDDQAEVRRNGSPVR